MSGYAQSSVYFVTVVIIAIILLFYASSIALAILQLKNQKTTSEKRTSSLQGTNGPSPMCPLFGGFTVATKQTTAKIGCYQAADVKLATMSYGELAATKLVRPREVLE